MNSGNSQIIYMHKSILLLNLFFYYYLLLFSCHFPQNNIESILIMLRQLAIHSLVKYLSARILSTMTEEGCDRREN